MTWRRGGLLILICVTVLLALLWLTRAWLAVQVSQSYFRGHGVASSVSIGDLGLSGVSGRFALGPADAPDISAERIELRFDPLRFLPRVVEVRLVHPVIRARVDAGGTVTLPSLQAWLDSLPKTQGSSRWVSDDLAVSLTGLRALLATPGGVLEVTGNARLVKNLPVSANLAVRPAAIQWQGSQITVRAATLMFDQARGRLSVRFSGALHRGAMDIKALDVSLDARGFEWQLARSALSARAVQAHLRASAASLTVGEAVSAPQLDVLAQHVALSGGDAAADLAVKAGLGFDAGALPAIRAQDAALANAIAGNLSRLELTAQGHVARHGGVTRFAQTAPILLHGNKGGELRITGLNMATDTQGGTATVDAVLTGAGLPSITLGLRDASWRGGGFKAQAALGARFNYAMLRGAAFTTQGPLSWQDGHLTFSPSACARFTLAAFHPGAGDLAKNLRAAICPPPDQPMLSADSKGWAFHAAARETAAVIPLSNSQLDNGAGSISFSGQGSDIKGEIAVTAARLSDLAPAPRFKPLSGTGTITLADWVLRGKIAATNAAPNATKAPLGEAVFSHVMATGAGAVHINADRLVFAPGKLQPSDISPLLAPMRSAQGTASFTGDIGWSPAGLTSSGTLALDSLDFITPLGKAHTVKTNIVFTSLLPPATAPNQQIAISRVDWTLPFTAIDVRLSVGDGAVTLHKVEMDFAEGHASTGGFTIKLDDPGHITGAIAFKSIALNSLITASNLGNKVKIAGKVSGYIPFTVSPEGFRIQNGSILADGPGRLAIDRSTWAQGEAALSSNAVQDFAYQAMENLAFDTMSADLNSIAGGRLQIVFKIKGKNDPPKHQTADVAIADIINGTALYKPIPLPSGTPIELTLDTSLNFDELLKSYTVAFSKSTDTGGGAKP